MGAVQMAEIRFALLHLVDAQERELPDAERLCAVLQVAEQEDQWIEILLGTLNFGYPHDDDPLELLRRRGVAAVTQLAIVAFEPKLYATVNYAPCAVDDLARFIDQLLMAIYALPSADYRLTMEWKYVTPGYNSTAQRDWYLAMPSRWAPRVVPQGSNGAASPQERRSREPALSTDHWELASAEHRNQRSNGTFWIPSLQDRAALQLGDLAQLLFSMQTDDGDGAHEVVVERMWVLVTELRDNGRFLGRLVNQPVGVDSRSHYLTLGAEVPFGTEHVVEIRRWDQHDIDDFLAHALHRKWQ
jgi:hypothetical protein